APRRGTNCAATASDSPATLASGWRGKSDLSSMSTNADGFYARLPDPAPGPIVVSVPHASVEVGAMATVLSPALDVRCDADLYVDRLYRIGEPVEPAACVAARLSRFICDLNRDP